MSSSLDDEDMLQTGVLAASIAATVLVALGICTLLLQWLHERRKTMVRAANIKSLLDRIENLQVALLKEREDEGEEITKDHSIRKPQTSLFRASSSLMGFGPGVRPQRSTGSTGSGNRPPLPSASNGFDGWRRQSMRPGRSTSHEVLNLEATVWRWAVDGTGTLTSTGECLNTAVRVLVCVNVPPSCKKTNMARGETAAESRVTSHTHFWLNRNGSKDTLESPTKRKAEWENPESTVAKALLDLCRHEMIEPTALRSCVVADRQLFAGCIRIDSRVTECGRHGAQTVADVLPVLCDVADYCIVVIGDDATANCLRTHTGQSRRMDRAPTHSFGTHKSDDAKFGRFEELVLGQTSRSRTLGPTCYLASLSVMSLKSDRQSFVVFADASGDDQVFRRIISYQMNSEKIRIGMEFDEEVAGVKLHGGLLTLWASVVSHGSFAFARDAAPQLAELPSMRHRASCLMACARRAGSIESMSDDVLLFFQMYRHRAPLMPRALIPKERRTTCKNLEDLARTKPLERFRKVSRAHHMSDLQASVQQRGIITRAIRLTLKGTEDQGEHFTLCRDDVPFTAPSNHPMAYHIWSVAKDVDFLLDHSAQATLDVLQKYLPLEDLSDRIQGFVISYLRKMNGASDPDEGYKAQMAAFELYTSGAEGQAYLVDLVSDFLCNRAEMRGYQKVMRVMAEDAHEDSEPEPEVDNVGALHSAGSGDELKQRPLQITVVKAKNLPHVRTSTPAEASADDLPIAYCTCEVEDSGMLLQTAAVQGSDSPEWNERLEFAEYTPGHALVFSVWHSDSVTRDSFLGRAVLPCGQFDKAAFQGDLVLQGGRGSSHRPQASTLKVKVSSSAQKRKRLATAFASNGSKGKLLREIVSSATQQSFTTQPHQGVGSRDSVRKSWTLYRRSSSFEQDVPEETVVTKTPSGRETLSNMLVSITQGHRKLERLMIDLVAEAKKEAESHGIWGSATVDQSFHRTSFWEMVESSTLGTLEATIWSEDQQGLEKSDRADMAEEVDKQLEAAEGDQSLIDWSRLDRECVAQTRVMCDSFWIMHLMMLRLQKSRHLIVHSRTSTFKTRRKTPAVTYTVSLLDSSNRSRSTGDDMMESEAPESPGGSVRLKKMEVVLAHKKIAAVGQENRSQIKLILSEMRTINSICRTLRVGDPDMHPSTWCLSLRQLQDFAREVESELGCEAYRAATCAEIVQKCIIKKTSAARTSYARMVNWQQLRQIDVFVSHCWGENFGVFVDSVVAALEKRIQASDVNLWICCFALYQNPNYHVVKKQVGTDLMDAPFEKALRFAREFLVVRNAECDMYTRAWCVYEIFRARQLDLKITVTGPDKFTKEHVDILSCKATDRDDESMIKGAIVDANEVDELNRVVSEIKAMGGGLDPAAAAGSNFPVVRI